MRTRPLVAAAVLALAASPIAHSSGTAARNCGRVSGGGAKWSVLAAHVSCRAAKPLIKTLAAKPHPGEATRLGTHLGLKCTELAGNHKREIACLSKGATRSVFGVTPPHK